MDDLISRQEAIEALFKLYEYQRDIDPTEATDLVRQGVYLAEKKIEQLPSAQPEQRLSCKNCIHLGHGYMMPCKNCKRNHMLPDWYEVETERKKND